jgi:hypothetical protein
MDRYAYFFGTSLFLIPWLILFFTRRDLRKEMLWSSVVVSIFGFLGELLWYTKDWVHPLTLTHTPVGIEDFILGFAAGGVAAVVFKELFKKDDYRSIKNKKRQRWQIRFPIIFGLLITDLLFRIFGIFSYYSNLVGFGLIIVIILMMRKDLIKESLGGGFLLTIMTLPVYWLTFYFFPNWKIDYWNWKNISGIQLWGIPYEDLVWWFIAGAMISVVYDYLNGLRLRKEAS